MFLRISYNMPIFTLNMKITLLFICCAMASVLAGACSCVSGHGDVDDLAWLDVDSVSEYDSPLPEMPEPTIKMMIRDIGPLAKVFNDSNYVHWQDAERIGIRPLSDTYSHFYPGRPLEKVVSCNDFYVEPLTYSSPYMVPEGAAMLHEIGRRFRDSLAARGGGDYRIKVTSVLRTPAGVRKLRRRNRNAIDSSVHQLGTTVDISYSRFAAYSSDLPRSAEDLKNLLGEVLYAMRAEGKCWVKYERKQPCYHVTVRPRTQQ